MKIIGLISCGRSGADLFQSLLDNHNQILQFPGYILFNKKLLKIFLLNNKKEVAERFCEIYPHFFDSRLNQEERHHQLGNTKSQHFTVNKKKFINFFCKSKIKKKDKLDILVNLNKSYYLASNRPVNKIKIFLIHFHLYDNLKNFLNFFSNPKSLKIIMTLRDILASLGSTCHKWLKFKPTALDAHTLYLNVVGHLMQINRLQKLKKKIYVVQLEKLHLDNTKVMREFCKIFKINFKSSLTKSTYFGKKWWGDKTSLRYLNGINKKFKNNFYENFFFQKDVSLIENKILNLIKFYDYPKRSNLLSIKILDLLPYKFEYQIWFNSFKYFNLKKIIKIPIYWILRIFNTYGNNLYKNDDFPYSIGSGKFINKL